MNRAATSNAAKAKAAADNAKQFSGQIESATELFDRGRFDECDMIIRTMIAKPHCPWYYRMRALTLRASYVASWSEANSARVQAEALWHAQAEKPDADGRLNEDRVHLDRIKRVLALQRLNETGILGTNAAAQQEDDVAIAAALAKLQGKLEPLKQTQSELVLGRSKPVESSAAQKADPSVKKGMQPISAISAHNAETWKPPMADARIPWNKPSLYSKTNAALHSFPPHVMHSDWAELSSWHLIKEFMPLHNQYMELQESLSGSSSNTIDSSIYNIKLEAITIFDTLTNLYLIHPSQNLLDAADWVSQFCEHANLFSNAKTGHGGGLWYQRVPPRWERPSARIPLGSPKSKYSDTNWVKLAIPTSNPWFNVLGKSTLKLMDTFVVKAWKKYHSADSDTPEEQAAFEEVLGAFKHMRDAFVVFRSWALVDAADFLAQQVAALELPHESIDDIWDLFPENSADDLQYTVSDDQTIKAVRLAYKP